MSKLQKCLETLKLVELKINIRISIPIKCILIALLKALIGR